MASPRELDGERRAPGTRAEHGDRFLGDEIAAGHGRNARGFTRAPGDQFAGPWPACACCCANPRANNSLKSTGGNTKFGKPPCVTRFETATRA